MDSIECKKQLINRLCHDAKPVLKILYDKGYIATADYKIELNYIFLTIKSYSDNIANLKADVLYINIYTTTNANMIFDFNRYTKTRLNNVHTKLD